MLALVVVALTVGYLWGRLDERRNSDQVLNLYLIAQKNGESPTKIRLQ